MFSETFISVVFVDLQRDWECQNDLWTQKNITKILKLWKTWKFRFLNSENSFLMPGIISYKLFFLKRSFLWYLLTCNEIGGVKMTYGLSKMKNMLMNFHPGIISYKLSFLKRSFLWYVDLQRDWGCQNDLWTQ